MHADGLRIMWRWRDWVIDAFRKNQPYDEFVTWQVAGDLLPNASPEQRVATGFYRNQPLNGELGIVPEEYRLKYVADRTNTTATAFLGLTMECASCHDHKFDPISQKEYYEMFAFFNNVKELGMIGNDLNFGPLVLLPDSAADQKIKTLTSKIEILESQKSQIASDVESLKEYVNKLRPDQIKLPVPIGDFDFDSFQTKKSNGRTIIEVDNNQRINANGTPEIVSGKIKNAISINSDYDQIYFKDFKQFDACDEFSAGAWVKTEKLGSFQSIIGNIGDKNTGWRGWLFFIDTLNRPGLKLVHNLSCNYIHIVAEESIDVNEWTHLFFAYDGSSSADGVRLYANGRPLTLQVHADHLYKNIRPVRSRNYQPDPGRNIRMGIASQYLFSETDDGVFYGAFDEVKIFDQFLTAIEVAILAGSSFDLNVKTINSQQSLEYYLHRKHDLYRKTHRELKGWRGEKFAIVDEVEEVMVMEEMPIARNAFILNRGQYDDLGDEVFANTPESILPFGERYPRNRLGLAQWLFDSGHPLTARVAVNRYWQMIFGQGIVNTPHDFGLQGALPSHPELIDWLAVEFRKSGWNLRSLLKMMVMSATYRQSSVFSDELRERDPKNIWLAKAPSQRMQMEMIRDNALAASGLLNHRVGGPSVKPYQPEGLWKEKNEFSGFLIEYEHDQGDDLYRRSMYTFIRRTSPPPIMTTFDAPARDVCTVKRETTNTPLQALVLLNDPQFVEAARILAERVLRKEGQTVEQRISDAFRLVCGRVPNEKQSSALMKQYHYESLKFRDDPRAADDFLSVGEMPKDNDFNNTETAALAVVCNTILNFDEAYMKR
ncbi:MAG: DUF1553 domain-containing protein [Saprospiraceae bacterium]|nr:DUF1553 domain-containing protein [Saprospiraceae bacterium]